MFEGVCVQPIKHINLLNSWRIFEVGESFNIELTQHRSNVLEHMILTTNVLQRYLKKYIPGDLVLLAFMSFSGYLESDRNYLHERF